MLYKNADSRTANNLFEKAGLRAETQMAFYLDRYFKDRKDVYVFHDIRFVEGNEVAQIDHLILEPFGIHVIESKSVTSRIRVNERDEWSREWDGVWKGMPSPVLQAKRQMDFLRKYLDAHALHLVKMLLPTVKFHWGRIGWYHWVAVSDDGIIEQKLSPAHQNLLKADQIPEEMEATMDQHRKDARILANLLNPPKGEIIPEIPPTTLARIALWLKNHHVSRIQEVKPIAIDPARLESYEPNPDFPDHANELPESKVCRFCRTRNIQVKRGPYGLYFKCLDCGKNTPIIFACGPACKPFLDERDAGFFFRVCPQCQTEKVYFKNS